jgi:TonB-linked outer membrane protein, SusC/RagA family/TonB-dependent outer membrane receptor, SusC/RagA subfamily, signature region
MKRKVSNLSRGILFMLLWTFSLCTFAQNVTVTGMVTDTQGESLVGVTIQVQGTSYGTVTDFNGRFTLSNVPPNGTLEVTYVGMHRQVIPINGRTTIDVVLQEDTQSLEEVVVVGYGTQRKVNLTGSVSAVSIDEKITSRSLSNVSSGLQGLIPGLQVSQSTSMAGRDGASLMIRGLGTVNNATPLVVVDGMPDVDINRINFADVESISVLKDAASASIYGSRAANGVILITTRTGKGASKTQITFNASMSVERPTRSYEFMADYPRALTIHQYRAASGTLRDNYNFKDGTIDQWMALGMIDPLRYPNTDWFDTFMRDGSLQNYTVSATGGGDRANFYISIGSLNNKGIQIHNDYARYNTRFNFDYEISDKFTVGARFDGNWSEFTYSGYEDGLTNNDTTDSGGGDMQYAISGILPYDPVSGRYGGAMAYGEDIQAYNPYAFFNSRKPTQTEQEVNGSMYIDWNPFKGFTAHLDYALSYSNYFQKRADMPTGAAYNFQTNSDLGRSYVADNASVSDNNTTSYKTQLNGRLNYHTRIAEYHDISALFVYSEEYWHTRSTGASRNDRLHPTITDINGALTNVISNSGSSASEGLRSYIGRLNYSAYDKYLFEFNFRIDGSSKFAQGSQYGFFPSVAVGWRFTEEAFLTPYLSSWLGNGKIRTSYGTTGNNSGVGRFEQLETLSVLNYMADDVVKGFVNRKMINRDLSWEESKVFNIGLDLGFFNNQLTSEIDYYDRLTSGMNRPSEMSLLLTGAYSAPRRNIGDMRNQGVELNLTWRDKVGKVDYSANLNGAYNRTVLEEWNEFLGRGWVFINMPYHFLYTYEDSGMAQTWEDIYSHTPQGLAPGDVIREDLNGDGIIDGKDRRAYENIQRDRPTTTFGLTLTAAWNGFDLSALFNGATGRKDYWITDFNNTSIADRRYASTWDHWNKPWSLENRNTDWPRLGTGTNRTDNSFYLYDLSYLRLKNMQVGYRIPSKLLSRLHISNIRVYVSAENLLTLTKYPGLDPEKPRSGRDLYPINRSYSVGINVGL